MTPLLMLKQLGLITLLAKGVFGPAATPNNPALIQTEPQTLQVGQGQVETLNLVLENAQSVYGIDVRATFDPSVLEIVDADPATEGVQMTPGSFPQPDFVVRNVADNSAGSLMYVVTQINPTPPANGNGLVVAIQVRGKSLGQQSTFTINFIELVDRQGRKLEVDTQSGVIVVSQPQPPTPTLSVAATTTTSVASVPAINLSGALTPALTEPAAATAQNRATGSAYVLPVLLSVGGLGALLLLVLGGWMMMRPTTRPTQRKSK